MKKVFLGVGSNSGDREKNIFNAFCYLKKYIDRVNVAGIYETLPLYFISQPKFLNTVMSGYTKLTPFSLLEKMEYIEIIMGRLKKNTQKMGPRCIDLDILLYENEILNTETLTIPHLYMKERQFVLKPLIELNPDIRDPLNGNLYSAVLQSISDQGVVYYSSWEEILKRNS